MKRTIGDRLKEFRESVLELADDSVNSDAFLQGYVGPDEITDNLSAIVNSIDTVDKNIGHFSVSSGDPVRDLNDRIVKDFHFGKTVSMLKNNQVMLRFGTVEEAVILSGAIKAVEGYKDVKELEFTSDKLKTINISIPELDNAVKELTKNPKADVSSDVIMAAKKLNQMLLSLAKDDINEGLGFNENLVQSGKDIEAVTRFPIEDIPKRGIIGYHATFTRNLSEILSKGFIGKGQKNRGDIWLAKGNSQGFKLAYEHACKRLLVALGKGNRDDSNGIKKLLKISVVKVKITAEILEKYKLKLSSFMGQTYAIDSLTKGKKARLPASVIENVKDVPVKKVIATLRDLDEKNYLRKRKTWMERSKREDVGVHKNKGRKRKPWVDDLEKLEVGEQKVDE